MDNFLRLIVKIKVVVFMCFISTGVVRDQRLQVQNKIRSFYFEVLCSIGLNESWQLCVRVSDLKKKMQKVISSDGSESRLGIDSTLARHFLADSDSILLGESRLGLDPTRSQDSVKTRVFYNKSKDLKTKFRVGIRGSHFLETFHHE